VTRWYARKPYLAHSLSRRDRMVSTTWRADARRRDGRITKLLFARRTIDRSAVGDFHGEPGAQDESGEAFGAIRTAEAAAGHRRWTNRRRPGTRRVELQHAANLQASKEAYHGRTLSNPDSYGGLKVASGNFERWPELATLTRKTVVEQQMVVESAPVTT